VPISAVFRYTDAGLAPSLERNAQRDQLRSGRYTRWAPSPTRKSSLVSGLSIRSTTRNQLGANPASRHQEWHGSGTRG